MIEAKLSYAINYLWFSLRLNVTESVTAFMEDVGQTPLEHWSQAIYRNTDLLALSHQLQEKARNKPIPILSSLVDCVIKHDLLSDVALMNR